MLLPVRFPILRFGVAPVLGGPSLRASLDQVGKALGYRLGTTVLGRVVPRHADLISLLSQGQLDAAWLPPVLAMECEERSVAVTKIALMRQRETIYQAVLFAKEESKTKTLADLHQVKAAWVSKESASGYLVPLASLRARGVSLARAFADQAFLGTHEAVIRAVAEGRADVGASFAHFNGTDMREMVSSSWTEIDVATKFRVLLSAGPIPTDVIVVHRSMSDGHQDALAAAFGWLASKPEVTEAIRHVFGCDGFAPCGEDHLRGLGKLIRLLDRAPRR